MRTTLNEIRARHEEGVRAGADEDRAYLLAEVDRLRAENERLYNEDTKTRHALRGWVWVCPDGGDEPTHERVSAVVAEVERLTRERDEARAEVERLRKEMLEVAEELENEEPRSHKNIAFGIRNALAGKP